jgi:putative phage-type endonuclease
MPRLSESELASRRTGMGSTCIVEANGLAPWSGAGPMRLYCEKLGIASPDDAEEETKHDEADWLDWGHVQEPVIADWYERTTAQKLQLGGPVYSREHPHFWATLDRTVIGAGKIVEIKNVGSPALYRHWDVSSQDGVPHYVRAQATIAMAFHGARETDVVASIGGRPPHIWTLAHDPELAELLIQGALRFWERVVNRTPPPLDATPASRAYLLAKYPTNADRTMLIADERAEAWAAERIELAVAESKAKARKTILDNELLHLVGDASGIEGNGWKLTWKSDRNGVRRTRFTVGRETE